LHLPPYPRPLRRFDVQRPRRFALRAFFLALPRLAVRREEAALRFAVFAFFAFLAFFTFDFLAFFATRFAFALAFLRGRAGSAGA
jgi:hypothetical protein